ncbi:MAG: aliphatic sulfonate ABC transporter substrate-binding protein [Prevotella sp.]|jgi:sulfonate transport system substrate-binding protein|nr:aliphatic sulfonate ABC transporter substrate-binding protein [Prevotella sp.]
MKNSFIIFLSACFYLSCQEKLPETKPEVIRIGYQIGHFPCIVAKHNRFFEEEFKNDSIRIEIRKFDYGPPEMEAFNAKRLDIGTIGDQPALVAWAKGVDIKVVANSNGGEERMALLIPKNSNIKSFNELKGKKIGITIGANTQHFLHILLKKEGWTMDDIEPVNLKFSDCIASLGERLIDASIVNEPYIALCLYRNTAKLLFYSSGYKYVTLPIVANSEFIEHYPDIVVRLLNVYRKSAIWAREHPDLTTEILLKEENNLLPREVDNLLIDKSTNNFDLRQREIQAFKETFEYLKETSIIKGYPDFNAFYVTKFDSIAALAFPNPDK